MGHTLRSALWFVLVPLPLAYGIPTTLGVIGTTEVTESAAIRGTGLVAAGLGTLGLIFCFAEFVRRGKGTPAPFDPPRWLVAAGLYRYSRNPMYVAVIITVAGQAAWWASWWIED